MPLLSLWAANPAAINELSIEQVVATAGDGSLKDGSVCSSELRQYLLEVESQKIVSYIEHCLDGGFPKSGIVLQDLINELGRRLDYQVTNGRYQGTPSAVGADGIWASPEKHGLVVEVKTTDTYRISLERIASYRTRLISEGALTTESSILIVVGREDTGELEAQVRGSRQAWDIRLISTDALMKLVRLKENAESPETGKKIRSLLAPMEYTRLDEMIEVMFATARDIEGAIAEATPDIENDDDVPSEPISRWQFTDTTLIQGKRSEIVAAMENQTGKKLIKNTRALYWDSEHTTRIVSTISKRYSNRSMYRYWYAYHPAWDEFLAASDQSFFVLGCVDQQFAFAIPWKRIHSNLEHLNTTTTDRSTYWHIHILETRPNVFSLSLPKDHSAMPVDEFRVTLS